MADEEENQDAFMGMLHDAFPEKMITNWIIVIESITKDSRDLDIATSDGMTTWLATGMLNCASEIVLNQGYGVDTEESEE
jgi:hypothetical protein